MSERLLDLEKFRQLVPVNGLREESLIQIHKRAVIRSATAGTSLFDVGSRDDETFFVINGTVELRGPDGAPLKTMTGGTPEALYRVAHQIPRRVSAVCKTNVEYLSLDSSLMDVMLTWDQTGSFELGEVEEGTAELSPDDWMTQLLQMKAFQKIPPANLQAMFMRLEQVQAKAGQVIIQQGDEGDYFYVLTGGKVLVTREGATNSKPLKLAEFGPGSCFGEEALISSAKRNATITMMTAGTLMRLAKSDFESLLTAPLTRKLAMNEAEALAAKGNVVWLDVRLPSEFKSHHIEGALNIPLYMLRPKLPTLPKERTYIVYCDSGRRSSVGAFVLVQKGYDAYLLHGGLPPNPSETA